MDHCNKIKQSFLNVVNIQNEKKKSSRDDEMENQFGLNSNNRHKRPNETHNTVPADRLQR